MLNYLPCDPAVITISVDKQDKVLKYVVFAWALDGSAWFIDYGEVDDEDALIELRNRPYYVSLGSRPRFIHCGVIDCNFRKNTVLRACYKAQHEHGWSLWPARGGGIANDLKTRSLKETEDWVEGGGEITIYDFQDRSIKLDFYLGTVQRREDPRLWMPDKIPPVIVTELTSEKLITKMISGQRKSVFVHPDDAPPNDYGDCFKMQKGVVWPLIAPELRGLGSDSSDSSD